MTPGSVPRAEALHRITSPAQMAELLQRQDLPVNAPWWTALVSVCNGRMIGQEVGLPDAENWGQLLVEALDRGRQIGALSRDFTVQRRIMACLAQLHYYGVEKGNPVRDPELVFLHLRDELGESPEELIGEIRGILSVRPDRATFNAQIASDLSWTRRVNEALGMVPKLVEYMHEGPVRSEAVRWSELVGKMPTDFLR